MKRNHFKTLHAPDHPFKKVLVLGYDQSQTEIIERLIEKNCHVDHIETPVIQFNDYDCAICFGYRHVLPAKALRQIKFPIFNLHMALLPYNRGAHPNFWSFFDETPSGVTIHLVDQGLDTGPIVYQRAIKFHRNEATFRQTYNRLKIEIEKLLIENLEDLLTDNWSHQPQIGRGTSHRIDDLPESFSGWDANISIELRRIREESCRYEK